MGTTAFNTPKFPTAIPFEEGTLEWFTVLANDKTILEGLQNSLLVGLGVICLSVPIGLAAALLMSQVHRKVQPIYYTIVVSPLLTPGVIIGISTLVFWDKVGTIQGQDFDAFYYNPYFLTIVGQSTFVSAYCMLIFLSRLQRFDRTLEEAALDLGATNVQVFKKIMLPFLKPAIGSAAVLAFLTSFENYNTTVFTMTEGKTLTTALASKARLGTDPSLSALAVVIVGITLVGVTFHEIYRRREVRKDELAAEAAKRAAHAADKAMAPV